MNKNSKIAIGLGMLGLSAGVIWYYNRRVKKIREYREKLESETENYLSDSPVFAEAVELSENKEKVDEVISTETPKNFLTDVFEGSYFCPNLERDFVDPKEIFKDTNNPTGLVHILQGSKHGSGRHTDFVNFLFEIPKYHKNRSMYPRLGDFTRGFKAIGDHISDDIVKFCPRPVRSGLVSYLKVLVVETGELHYLEVPRYVYESLADPEHHADGVAKFFELKNLSDTESDVYISLCSWLQEIYGVSGVIQVLSIELMYSLRFNIIGGELSDLGMSRKQFLDALDYLVGAKIKGTTGAEYTFGGVLFHPGNEKDNNVLTEYLDIESGLTKIVTREP